MPPLFPRRVRIRQHLKAEQLFSANLARPSLASRCQLVSLSAANTAGAVCRGPRTPSPAYLTAHELPVQLDGSSSSCSASFPPRRTRGHHTLPSHASLTHPSRVTGPGARFKFIVLFCAMVFAPVVISDFPSQRTAFEPLILFSEIVS